MLTVSSLPARPSTLPPRPASPEPRKRLVDPDDDSRSQKRSRTDGRNAHDDAVRQSRDEAPRRKDRDSLAPSDHRSDRDRDGGRFPTPSSLTNGRNVLKNTTSARNSSPAGRARGSSVNGVRPAHSASAKNTPTKVDVSSRPSLPPLLSPLHLNLDSRDASDRDKKRAREDAVDGTKPSKPKRLDEPPRQRRERSPARIPPLLSPTLPPLIESELSKRAKVGGKGDKNRETREKEERHDVRSNDERYREERSSTGRKSRPEQDEEEPVRKERQKSLIVTLPIPRSLRARVRNLLAQPPARKEPPSANLEAQSGQAKKRPAAASETIADSISVKRPRTSSMSQPNRLPPPPSTPSKRGTTAMSRVSSSNSQVHTPGDVASATPAPLASAERPVNGNDGSRQAKLEDAAAQEREHQRFSNLGRHLKHNGDIVMKKAAAQAANGSREMDSSYKLGYVLSVESILAFMTGFQALNMNRNLLGKVRDSKGWESLFPLLEFLQRAFRADLRRYRILYTLILMLHAVTVEEVIKCYTTYDNPSNHVTLQALIQHERNRTRLWQLVRDANAAIETDYLCANITPWSTIDDISASVLRVLRRWCEDENVKWAPEMNSRNADSRSHRN